MQVTVRLQEDDALEGLSESGHRVLMDRSVSYTHLTLPTNREV